MERTRRVSPGWLLMEQYLSPDADAGAGFGGYMEVLGPPEGDMTSGGEVKTSCC